VAGFRQGKTERDGKGVNRKGRRMENGKKGEGREGELGPTVISRSVRL